jgi:uncharacterized protein YqgV (UPF0045/DUF77 family)
MGTTIEGELEQVFAVVHRCFEALATDCDRIECSTRIDYRRGDSCRLDAKIARIEEKLGRTVKK